jgi:1,5-anhydro-D-fructose reductase (1,5-anhydro-D-mannitol-forming)
MTIRWGIIGCGDVCEVKSGPAFYKARGSALSVVMRRDGARAADFAKRHNVAKFTTDAEAVICDPEVDAVYIATPPGEHLEYALAVARAGKPCYVEKPMARSAAECRAMIEAFERAGKRLFVAYYRRALPRFLKVRDILGSGALGSVLTVSHVYQGRAHPDWNTPGFGQKVGWREDVAESGGGLFLDLGSHVVDLLDFLLGPLSGVSGHAARRASALGSQIGAPEDAVVFSFGTQSGVIGTARYQFHTAGAVDRLELVGTKGTLSLSVFGQDPIDLNLAGTHERISTQQPEHVHLPLVQSIVDELEGGKERCASSAESALRASQVMDQVLDAYYGGRFDAFWARPETWPGPRLTQP